MKNLILMRQQKDTKLEEVRAILDGAEAQGRNLTAEENARYSTGMKEVRRLAEELEEETAMQEREMRDPSMRHDVDGGHRDSEFRSYGKDNLSELRTEYGSAEMGQTFNSWLKGIITGKGEQRQDPSTISAQGTYLVPYPLFGEFIEDAWAKTQCMQAGARLVNLDTGNLRVPRITGLPTTEWLAETQAASPDELQIDGVTLEAAKLSVQVRCSVELYEDSALLRDEVGGLLTKALAIELDRAALVGGGPIVGIAGTAGVHEIDPVGAITNYTPFVYGNGLIQSSCYTTSALIMNPNTAAAVDNLMDTTNQPMQPPPSWDTYRRLVTCNLDCVDEYEEAGHCAIMGQFNRLFWAVRNDARVEISRCAEDAWRNYLVEIRAYLRAVPVVISPQAFCVLRNINEVDLNTI